MQLEVLNKKRSKNFWTRPKCPLKKCHIGFISVKKAVQFISFTCYNWLILMKTFSWRFDKKGRHFNRKVKKSNVKIHVILLIWNINEQFTQFCKSYPGLRIRIREDPEFFQLLDPDPGKKSWIRIQESLCQKLFIFEQNLTNSKVKTGLRIRIRKFFSSWIRIREKYFRRIRIRENISRIRNSGFGGPYPPMSRHCISGNV